MMRSNHTDLKRGTLIVAAINNDKIILAADSRTTHTSDKGTYSSTEILKLASINSIALGVAGLTQIDEFNAMSIVRSSYLPDGSVEDNADRAINLVAQSCIKTLNNLSASGKQLVTESSAEGGDKIELLFCCYENGLPKIISRAFKITYDGSVFQAVEDGESRFTRSDTGVYVFIGYKQPLIDLNNARKLPELGDGIDGVIWTIQYTASRNPGIDSNVNYCYLYPNGNIEWGKNY